MARAFSIKDQKAETVAKVLVQEVFSRFGVPTVLHSDQGRNFESLLVKEICSILGIRKSRTTPYHPQGDGLVERLNQTLVSILKSYVSEHQRDWDDWMPLALMSYRTSKQGSTQETPYKLMSGRDPRTTVDAAFDTHVPPAQLVTEYAEQLQEQQRVTRELVEDHLVAVQHRQAINYNKTIKEPQQNYQVGDLVWLFNTAVNRGLYPKLKRPWLGPFVITGHRGERNFIIRHPEGGQGYESALQSCEAISSTRSKEARRRLRKGGRKYAGNAGTIREGRLPKRATIEKKQHVGMQSNQTERFAMPRRRPLRGRPVSSGMWLEEVKKKPA